MENKYSIPNAFIRIQGRVYCTKCGKAQLQDSYHLETHAEKCGFRDLKGYEILTEEDLFGYTFAIEQGKLVFRVYQVVADLKEGPLNHHLECSWREVFSAKFSRESREVEESGFYNVDIWMKKFMDGNFMTLLCPDAGIEVIYRYFANIPEIFSFGMFLDIYRQKGYRQKDYDIQEELQSPLDETIAAIFRENDAARDAGFNPESVKDRIVAITRFEKYGELFLKIDASFFPQRIILSRDFMAYTGKRPDFSFLTKIMEKEEGSRWIRSGEKPIVFLEYPDNGVMEEFARRYPSFMIQEYLKGGGENCLVPLLSPNYNKNLELLSKAGLGKLCNIFEKIGKLDEIEDAGRRDDGGTHQPRKLLNAYATDVKGMLHLPVKLLKKMQELDEKEILRILPSAAKIYACKPAFLQVENFTPSYVRFLSDCAASKVRRDGVPRPVREMNRWSEKEMIKTIRYVAELFSEDNYTLYRDYLTCCTALDSWRYGKWPKMLKKAHDEMALQYYYLKSLRTVNRPAFLEAIKEEEYISLATEDTEKTKEAENSDTDMAETENSDMGMEEAKKSDMEVAEAENPDMNVEEAGKLETEEPYIVRLPREMEDLARESSVLHHCVVTYTERVARRDTYILFLRRREQPDKPFATMEVLPSKKGRYTRGNAPCLIQLKAINNNKAPIDAQRFVRRWARAKGVMIQTPDMTELF
ncbi:MAG: PcfJ domain-containing protein [Lachnospiraceae bacterium]|nr:PcfJ domain-containing protein [Lachnospiraceae bacterium]